MRHATVYKVHQAEPLQIQFSRVQLVQRVKGKRCVVT